MRIQGLVEGFTKLQIWVHGGGGGGVGENWESPFTPKCFAFYVSGSSWEFPKIGDPKIVPYIVGILSIRTHK